MTGAGAGAIVTRVGYVVSQFPCYDETFILREMKALRERGVEITIFSLRRKRQAMTQADAQAFLPETRYAPYLSFGVLRALASALLRTPGVVLGLVARLVRDLWHRPVALGKSLAFIPKSIYFAETARRLDLSRLHAHWATHPATAALLMSRLTGVAWSFTCHAHDIFAEPILLPEKLRSADFALTCTSYNRDFLASLDRVEPGRVRVSYHGLDLGLFQPNGASPSGGEAVSILAVGSLLECKGFHLLIEACRILTERGVAFRATLAGGGPLENELKALVARHRLAERIRFTGFLTQEALVPLYQQADLFVLPSVPEIHWGIPNVLVEAFACGLPVITTRLPSVPELVEDGVSGILLDAPEPERIAESIETLAASPERRAEMGRAGRARVAAAFDLDRNADSLVELMTAGVSAP